MTKVILLQNIKGYGQIGDVKNVADGYARNFLLPRNMAKLATSGAMKEVEGLKKKLSVMLEVEKKNAEGVAEKLKDMTIEITRKANEAGTLFDGIDKSDIAEAVKKTAGVNLNEDMVLLDEKIKKVGERVVDLELMPEIKTQIKVLVKNEE